MAPAVPAIVRDRLCSHGGHCPGGLAGHSARPTEVSPLPKERGVQLWRLALHLVSEGTPGGKASNPAAT